MNRSPSSDAQQIAEATTQPLLQEVEELMARDQRRKALLVIPLAIGVGAAIATQATWLLAVASAGLLLSQLPQRRA